MKQPDIYRFKNSPTCEGVGVVRNDDVTHDVITITGRYPAEGLWARNLEAREEVAIVQGIGSVAIRGVATVGLDAANDEERAVVVEPGEWFSWDGQMIISMVCRPGFDPKKYEIKTEDEIRKEAEQ